MTRVTRRGFLQGSLASGLALTVPGRHVKAAPFSKPTGANSDIRVAVIGLGQVGGPGVGARGRQLIGFLRKVPGVRIVALCDVDKQILDRELQQSAKRQERVKPYTDMRDVFAAPDVDAVFIATPNHWHALATIWACQAGKDVYVEKPASYSLWEGQQMVAAARKYRRIVQVGTQARSSDICRQAVELIQGGQLGKIRYVHALIYRRREGMGKVTAPQPAPASVDYNLWLGPADDLPLRRRVFHYDWHWIWNTGNGEIGNNGVHYLDRCRWLLGQNGLPPRAMSIGGRFALDDDGQTANTQIALLDYQPAPIICEVRNLPEKTGSKQMDKFRSQSIGELVQCEGGHYLGSSRSGAVFDNDGKKIKEITDRRPAAERGSAHQANFIEAVRSRRGEQLTADIVEGHRSAALCHLANLSYRLGQTSSPEAIVAATKGNPQWSDAFARFEHHLAANGIDLANCPATLGPWITVEPETERLVGDFAEQANALSRRRFRGDFVVPEIA